MKKIFLILSLFLFSGCAHNPTVQPIIDVHRHGTWPESDDAPYREALLTEKKQNNVALSLLSITEKDDLDNWHDAAPGRFMIGIMLPCPRNLSEPYYKCFPETEGWADLDWLRTEIEAGRISLIHEMTLNYYGINAGDERLAPYWALAAEFDLPVGIHTGRGPGPGAKNSTRSQPGCCPNYDKEMGNPDLLRPILERHPGLRIWIQHVGSGRGEHTYHWEEAMALLTDYPNVYLDLSITNSVMSEQVYADALRRLFKAGFGDRIMYGTDNLPSAPIIERLSRVEFLSESQRRGILYDNAAKFLRLDEKTRQAHKRAVQ